MTPRGDQRGFALLVLLAVVGIGSAGVLLAVQGLARFVDDRRPRAEANVAFVAAGAHAAFVATGAFPASLDALAGSRGWQTAGAWRTDPYGAGADVEYRSQTGGRRVRSRGFDGRLGTADDVRVDLAAEEPLRLRQRGTLRLLRARLLASPFRSAATMSTTDRQDLRQRTRDYANARRAFLTAGAAERAVLQATMDAARTAIETLCTAHGCPPLPTRMTGASGLPRRLGLPDSRAVDGLGRRLLPDPAVGFVAAGNDRTGGTDDDM
jgi:type II secretory pathway pseudopilin PulG